MSSLSRLSVPVSRLAAVRTYATKRNVAPHPNSVPLQKAIAILKAYEVGQPSQTVELHVHCAPEKGQPPIRGSCILPRAFKSDISVLVFAEGEKAKEAREAGADFVGGEELVNKVRDGEVKFDKCLSTPGMLPKVAKIARLLGPKGLMPTVNKGTVTSEVAEAIRFSKNSQDFRADKKHMVNTGVAKIGFSEEEIKANIATIMESIRANAKGNKTKFISRVYLSSTRGPGVQVADA
ncbi:ribosomal protein L1 [Linderina pennispora]|uniref:Ribosomal protein L1 n=1 Tax=Linderina pennispora TaxID=61395 RepID=A0A1Y1WMD1_9FUNG|nr:ribosomal protein L1 [Linderina pennispora]ORX74356.1 ribosomal protein L1 [Linderina pennispora]